MRKSLLIISSLLILGLTSCNTPTSSSQSSSSSSSSSTVVDTRTAKEKVLDVCDIIIENTKDQTLFSSTTTSSGKVTINTFDSTSGKATQNEITLNDFTIKSVSEIEKENKSAKLLYTIKGDYKVYSMTQEGEEIETFENEGKIDEKMMLLGENLYLDLSSFCNDFFSEEQLGKASELQLKEEGFTTTITNAIKEAYPDMETENIEIPDINPNELLDKIVGDDSLFKDYIKYSDENGKLQLKVSLKPADFNELLNDLMLEYDPESNIPTSTIVSMDNGNVDFIFNFNEDSIQSMDYSINARFSVLVDQYSVNVKLSGSATNDQLNEFTYLDNYSNYVPLSEIDIDVGSSLSELLNALGDLEFDTEGTMPI